ncbi:MAG: hypothetical protein V4710_16935 [Verrucomicrobiota bacterium]
MNPLPEVVVAEIEALNAAKVSGPRFTTSCSRDPKEEERCAAIDAQIRTLQEGLTFESVSEQGWSPSIEQAALEARDWMNGEPVCAPSKNWQSVFAG